MRNTNAPRHITHVYINQQPNQNEIFEKINITKIKWKKKTILLIHQPTNHKDHIFSFIFVTNYKYEKKKLTTMIPHHQTLRHTIHTPNTQTTYISRKATAFEEIYEARAKPGSHVTSWESCRLRDVAGAGEGDRRRLESVAPPPVRRKTPWKLL